MPSWSPRTTNDTASAPASIAAAILFTAAAAAWILLVVTRDEMPMDVAPWLGLWTAMMAAMMLPSTAPLVLLYARRADPAASVLLMTGYVLVWAVTGFGAYELAMRFDDPRDAVVGSVLAVAGAYQLTPLKSACLKRCRNPVDFLVTHWRNGSLGALRLGVEHGAFCLGCCWGLMAVLVVAGAMAFGWVVAIALVVAGEKLLPGGHWIARGGGIGLLIAGLIVAF